MSSIVTNFGQAIRQLRTQRGLSQEALGALAGISRTYIGELERGAAVASLDTAHKIADALQERLSYVVSLYE